MKFFLIVCLTTAVASGVFVAWRRKYHRSRKFCEDLWRRQEYTLSLKAALDGGHLEWINTSLNRMPLRHATLSDGLEQTTAAVLQLYGDLTDPRNTYLPKSLKLAATKDCRKVLVDLFEFAQRLYVLESRGHQPPAEQAQKVTESFAHTRNQVSEARAALAKLTFGASEDDALAARDMVKAVAWQANAMYETEQMLSGEMN